MDLERLVYEPGMTKESLQLDNIKDLGSDFLKCLFVDTFINFINLKYFSFMGFQSGFGEISAKNNKMLKRNSQYLGIISAVLNMSPYLLSDDCNNVE